MLRKLIWILSHSTPHFKGKEFILRLLSRPTNSNNKYLIIRNGTTFSISGQDLNEFYLAIRKYHSPNLHFCISKIIQFFKFNVLFDIGASIGGVSLPIVSQNINLHAYLFEPSPEVLSRLLTNISLNKKISHRIKTYDFAASNSNLINRFYVSSEKTNSGVGGSYKYHNRNNNIKLYKQYIKFDDLILKNKILPIPQIIKIDVEGFEFEVLTGMKKILKKYFPVLVFEHSTMHLVHRNFPLDKVNFFLISLGYSIYNIDDFSLVKKKQLSKNNDFIAMKKKDMYNFINGNNFRI